MMNILDGLDPFKLREKVKHLNYISWSLSFIIAIIWIWCGTKYHFLSKWYYWLIFLFAISIVNAIDSKYHKKK